MNGDDPPERPSAITHIISGLERYNPEAVGPLEAYLQEQCDQKYCDCNANRTLLKLYETHPMTTFVTLLLYACSLMTVLSTFPIT
jgi:translation initiation factor 3 subunit K